MGSKTGDVEVKGILTKKLKNDTKTDSTQIFKSEEGYIKSIKQNTGGAKRNYL